MGRVLRESEIKAALIDRLVERGMLQNAVLINEMVVANWSRRVDLAIANGNLHAYEIKSDLDSLKRLDGQLDAYLARFDKTTVVCAPRFTTEVLRRTPTFVEVLEVGFVDEEISFKVVRRGVLRPIQDKGILAAFLLKSELAALLKNQAVTQPRNVLVESVRSFPVAVLRRYVLECLKRRYKETSASFLHLRNENEGTQVSYLGKLSRSKQEKTSITRTFADTRKDMTSCYAKNINWRRIAEKFGDIPDDVPMYVLRRRCN